MAPTVQSSHAGRQGRQSSRGPLTVVACVRPSCQRCVGRDEKCHYVAEPDRCPTRSLKAALESLQQRIEAQEELVRLLTTVSEADALQLLARLRRGEDIDSLLEPGRQILNTRDTRDGSFVLTERTLPRRASVDGIIPIVPLEARSMSEHLAAIVASTPLTVLEPNVDLANNLRQLDAANSLRPSGTEAQTRLAPSDQATDNNTAS
ncbi:hypothetical protein Q7P35_002071 [Cladosporium inversicolor]